jgi:hypothetical protein
MLTIACAGPLDPEAAGEIAAATPASRIPDAESRFGAIEDEPGGLRTLAQVALPGATRPPRVNDPGPGQAAARAPGPVDAVSPTAEPASASVRPATER